MIDFILMWIGMYAVIITAMYHDNINWISSSPEFKNVRKLGFFKSNGESVTLRSRKYKTYLDYVFRIRILGVLKDWRDITPGILSSFAITLGFFTIWWLGGIILIGFVFLAIIKSKYEKPRSW